MDWLVFELQFTLIILESHLINLASSEVDDLGTAIHWKLSATLPSWTCPPIDTIYASGSLYIKGMKRSMFAAPPFCSYGTSAHLDSLHPSCTLWKCFKIYLPRETDFWSSVWDAVVIVYCNGFLTLCTCVWAHFPLVTYLSLSDGDSYREPTTMN